MMGFYNGYMGFGFGWIFMFFFWVIIIGFVLAFIRGGRHWGGCGYHPHGHLGRHGDDAMDILRQRYAKGEINKAQYEEMKAELDK